MSKTVTYPDRHHLNAAQGWLELGNLDEARADADKISLSARSHPEPFLLRWRIATRRQEWDEAHRLARLFTKVNPGHATGWICLSYTLYRLRRPLEAWMLLLPKMADFPKVSAIPYILACYAWELGNHKLVTRFLTRSAELGGPSRITDAPLSMESVGPLDATPSEPLPDLPAVTRFTPAALDGNFGPLPSPRGL
jgi:hypothetical protein